MTSHRRCRARALDLRLSFFPANVPQPAPRRLMRPTRLVAKPALAANQPAIHYYVQCNCACK